MTRKDYVLLAKAISDTQERIRTTVAHFTEQDQQLRGVRRAAAHICDALAADNPRFDGARFLEACGYGGQVWSGPRITAIAAVTGQESWKTREALELQKTVAERITGIADVKS